MAKSGRTVMRTFRLTAEEWRDLAFLKDHWGLFSRTEALTIAVHHAVQVVCNLTNYSSEDRRMLNETVEEVLALDLERTRQYRGRAIGRIPANKKRPPLRKLRPE